MLRVHNDNMRNTRGGGHHNRKRWKLLRWAWRCVGVLAQTELALMSSWDQPDLSEGENISSEFNLSVVFPPTWFLFTLSVAAQLPTHLHVCLTCLMRKPFFELFCSILPGILQKMMDGVLIMWGSAGMLNRPNCHDGKWFWFWSKLKYKTAENITDETLIFIMIRQWWDHGTCWSYCETVATVDVIGYKMSVFSNNVNMQPSSYTFPLLQIHCNHPK